MINQVLAKLSRRFECPQRNTTVGREFWAGATNFLVMSYVIVLIPSLLRNADVTAATVSQATCVTSFALCVMMGLVANRPFALAPGVGIASIVAYDVLEHGLMTWKQAMGAITLEGLIVTTLIALGLHRELARGIPRSLKCAIAIGIGAFLMKLGLFRGLILTEEAGEIAVARFDNLEVLVSFVGFVVTISLFVSKWKNAAVPVGIVFTAVLARFVAPVAPPGLTESVLLPKFSSFGLPGLTGLVDLFGASDLAGSSIAIVVLSLMLTDTFDSLGTSYTMTRLMGDLGPNDEVPKLRKVLLVDALGAVAGGSMGCSSVTTYVESAAGIGSGGRTGLTAVVTGVLFLAALFVAPLVGLVPDQATAPALIFIGFVMAGAFREIDWTRQEDGIPALLIIIVMITTQSITDGIGIGFIAYSTITVFRLASQKAPKLHPLMWTVTALFLIHFGKGVFLG